MSITLTEVVPAQVIGNDYKRAVLKATFDSSYPTGGEIAGFDSYGFTKITGIKATSNNNGYALELSGTESGGEYTASTAKLVAKLIKPYEVSGTVEHDDTLFDASATTDSAVLAVQPANTTLVGIEIGIVSKFVAASMTALTVEVGDGSDVDGYFDGTIDLVDDDVGDVDTTKGVLFNVGGIHKTSATNLTATVTATGADLDTTTAGEMSYTIFYYPDTADGCIGGPGVSEVPNTADLSSVFFNIEVEGY
jgi:hypothetical protein